MKRLRSGLVLEIIASGMLLISLCIAFISLRGSIILAVTIAYESFFNDLRWLAGVLKTAQYED